MKNWYLVLGMSALVLGGCGQTAQLGKTQNEEIKPVVSQEKATVESTLKDLLAGGKDQKCKWSFTDTNGTMNGTLYISGKKFKQEVTLLDKTTNKDIQMFTVSDGENMYIWNSMTGTTGFKTKITEAQKVADGITGAPQQGKVDWEKQYQYKCEAWNASQTDLTPPAGVTFNDMSEQLQKMQDLQKNLGGKFKMPGSEAGSSGSQGE